MSPRRKSLQQSTGGALARSTPGSDWSSSFCSWWSPAESPWPPRLGESARAIVCKIAQQIPLRRRGSYESAPRQRPYAANPLRFPRRSRRPLSRRPRAIKVTGDVSDGSSVRRTTYAPTAPAAVSTARR